MEKYPLDLNVAAELDGAFTPQQMSMMQRVFDAICAETDFDDPIV